MNKPKIRIERAEEDDGDGEYIVYEYGPRNICSVELFRGDIAECQDYAQEYVHDLRELAAGR